MDRRRRVWSPQTPSTPSTPSTTSYSIVPSTTPFDVYTASSPWEGVDTVRSYDPVPVSSPDPASELRGFGGLFEQTPTTEYSRSLNHRSNPPPILHSVDLSTRSGLAWERSSMHGSRINMYCFPKSAPSTPVGAIDRHLVAANIFPRISPQPSAELRHYPTQQNTVQRVVCEWDGCNTTFSRAPDMKRHMQFKHLSRGAFPCPLLGCDKVCHRKDNLTEHLKTHQK